MDSSNYIKALILASIFGLFNNVVFAQINTNDEFSKKYPLKNEPLRIGLALPFHSLNTKPNALSEAMLDYYMGIKLAFSELETEGFIANVSVWDTEPTDSLPLNQLAIKNILTKTQFVDQDILVGPVYEQNFKDLFQNTDAQWRKMPSVWVSPMGYIKPNKLKSAPPTDMKVYPNLNFFINDTLRYKAVANNVATMFRKHRLCIIVDGDALSKKKSIAYKQVMSKISSKPISIHSYKNGILTPALPKKDSTVIIACTTDATMRSTLEKLVEKRKQCWLIADLSWFEDKRFYTGLNDEICIYPTINFMDFHDSATLNFSRSYFAVNGIEPSRFSYIGYDQANFIGYSSMAFGADFIQSLPDATFDGVINSIHIKTGGTAPYNDGLRFVMIYEDTAHLFLR